MQPRACSARRGGYVGSTTYGALTAALRDQPEINRSARRIRKKAHPEVHKRFLTAWNDGFITEVSDGTRVPTTRCNFSFSPPMAASRRIGTMAQAHAGPLEGTFRR